MNSGREKDYETVRRRTEESCVLTYEPDKCYNGYTLFSNYRGNVFYLIDMKGHLVHNWRVKMAKVGEILPDGHLMYGNMWSGMAEIDWDSTELWYYPCSQHHDFSVMPNGHVMILCGIEGWGSPPKPVCERRLNPELREGGLFGATYLVEVDPETNETFWEWWSHEHLEELREAGVEFPRRPLDVFHTNTCEVLPETKLGKEDPRFRSGNVVFSHRNVATVGVIDKRDGAIVWAWGPGELDGQHMPTLIPDTHPITGEAMPGAGHFLIFDNGTRRKYSRILELDPRNNEIVWEYRAPEFFGSWGAGQDRMPNGNTVISEGGNRGRLFEVTPEGEVVWDYLTPYLDGAGRDHAVYRCVRYPADYIEDMLKAKKSD